MSIVPTEVEGVGGDLNSAIQDAFDKARPNTGQAEPAYGIEVLTFGVRTEGGIVGRKTWWVKAKVTGVV